MKTLWQVAALLAVIHILGALGIAGWLLGTNRVNRQRLAQIRDVFAQSIAQEETSKKQSADQAKAAEQEDARKRALEGAGAGPESATQKLAAERQKNEIALRQMERAKSDIEALRRQIQQMQTKIDQDKKTLEDQRLAFNQQVKKERMQSDEKGFKKTVSLYESLPSRQAKDMFTRMIAESKIDQVIGYLESMQPRKAAGVLKEFKSGEEIAQAVQITEKLRAKGSALAKAMEASK